MALDIDLIGPHTAQRRVLDEAERFNVVACGRRWGKTDLGCVLTTERSLGKSDAGLRPGPVGWFAPTYKLLQEAWDRLDVILSPLGAWCERNKAERQFKLATGGVIDFWTLEKPYAGRGRKYGRVVVDEAAMARDLMTQWTQAIRPTLTDLRGDAWFFSTPLGMNDFHRLWAKGGRDTGWRSWQMPSATNPHLDPAEIEAARLDLPADAFSQEYLAEFLSDAANPFGVDAIRACVYGDALEAGPVAVWGVDLAKSVDWTCVIGLDLTGRVVAFQRFRKDWKQTMAHVAAMIGDRPALVDETGVGSPIVEMLQTKCPFVQGVTFTATNKQQLMEGLAVAIQQGAVAYPAGPIVHELEMFRYEYRPTGVRYTAPDGEHDDCVDALALAVQCLRRRPAAASMVVIGLDDDVQDERWFSPLDNEAMWR